jgi:hypothetical protein
LTSSAELISIAALGQAGVPKPEDWADTIRMRMEEQVVQKCDAWTKHDVGYVAYFQIGQKGLLPEA